MGRSIAYTAPPNGYVTRAGAAELLGVTEITVYRLWQRGQLKKYKAETGRSAYYRISELKALRDSKYRGELTVVNPTPAESSAAPETS